jgi:hypothetical protein
MCTPLWGPIADPAVERRLTRRSNQRSQSEHHKPPTSVEQIIPREQYNWVSMVMGDMAGLLLSMDSKDWLKGCTIGQ